MYVIQVFVILFLRDLNGHVVYFETFYVHFWDERRTEPNMSIFIEVYLNFISPTLIRTVWNYPLVSIRFVASKNHSMQ